jgi:hypothetical protein
MIHFTLTKEERAVIIALKRIAKRWPKTLWLFSASGELHVMRNDENGDRVFLPTDGVDQEYVVDIIDISNDGGGW